MTQISSVKSRSINFNQNGYINVVIGTTTSSATSSALFVKQVCSVDTYDLYYSWNVSNEMTIKLIPETYTKITNDFSTYNILNWGHKYPNTATFSIPNTNNSLNAGKLWVASATNYVPSGGELFYIELGSSNKGNNYFGNHKVLNYSFISGLWHYSLDVDRQILFSGEVINGVSITRSTGSDYQSYVNYTPELLTGMNKLSKNRIARKILNSTETSNAGFLTNYKNKKIPYLSDDIMLDQSGAFIYKIGSVINGLYFTNSFTNISATISTVADNVVYSTKIISVSDNAYRCAGTASNNAGKLNYEYRLVASNGLTDKITLTNILSPDYQGTCYGDWICIRYLNPYGVYDSLTLFGKKKLMVDATREYRKELKTQTNQYPWDTFINIHDEIANNEIKTTYTFDSDWLSKSEYEQFGEVIMSKEVYLLSAEDNVEPVINGSKASIFLAIPYLPDAPPFGELYVDAGFWFNFTTVGFGTLSYTFSTDAPMGPYPSDAILNAITLIEATSTIDDYYDLSWDSIGGTEGILFTAKNNGTQYNITSYNSRTSGNQDQATGTFSAPIDGVDATNLNYDPFNPIIIENTNFDYRYADNADMKKLNFVYRNSNINKN